MESSLERAPNGTGAPEAERRARRVRMPRHQVPNEAMSARKPRERLRVDDRVVPNARVHPNILLNLAGALLISLTAALVSFTIAFALGEGRLRSARPVERLPNRAITLASSTAIRPSPSQ